MQLLTLKRTAILLSILPLFLFLYFWIYDLRPQIDRPWIPSLGIHFALSIDSLSLIFIVLTTLITPLAILVSDEHKIQNPLAFYGSILILELMLLGFFCAADLILFAFFWEGMLIPIYILLVCWGDEEREKTGMKFLLYTLSGSVLMIIAILSLYFLNPAHDFLISAIAAHAAQSAYTPYLCAIFLLAFAVKTPLFPFHGWLPDAYCRSPLPVTILLSAVLSKAGIYGFLRIGPTFFFAQIETWSPFLLTLSIGGVIYGAFAAWMQADFKRLIAYSSLSHVNFILAGIFVQQKTAATGAILQSLNHALTVAALFIAADWVERRIRTTSIHKCGGLCLYMPKLCWMTLFFVLASIGLPGLNNFVGEILILFGFVVKRPWTAPIIATTLILSAVYMLRWMQQLYFGPPHLAEHAKNDLSKKELLIGLGLATAVLFLGIRPGPLLDQAHSAMQTIFNPSEIPPQ